MKISLYSIKHYSNLCLFIISLLSSDECWVSSTGRVQIVWTKSIFIPDQSPNPHVPLKVNYYCLSFSYEKDDRRRWGPVRAQNNNNVVFQCSLYLVHLRWMFLGTFQFYINLQNKWNNKCNGPHYCKLGTSYYLETVWTKFSGEAWFSHTN